MYLAQNLFDTRHAIHSTTKVSLSSMLHPCYFTYLLTLPGVTQGTDLQVITLPKPILISERKIFLVLCQIYNASIHNGQRN